MRRRSAIAAWVCGVAVAWSVQAAPASAQVASEGDETPANRTVVKDPATGGDWAPSDAVIGRDDLLDAGTSVAEVLDEQPGLRVTRLGGLGSFSLLSVRGSSADQVLVLVDGIPLNAGDGGSVDLSTLPVGPIGSVALYRGLSPTIFGSSAIGGAVDLRTRGLQGQRLELELGAGSFDSRIARAFYGVGGDRWGAGVAIDYSGGDGDFGYTHDGGTAWTPADDVETKRTHNRFDRVAVMAKGHVAPVDGLRLTALNLFTRTARQLPGIGLFPAQQTRAAHTRNLLGLRAEADGGWGRLLLIPHLTWTRSELEDPLGELGLTADETRDETWVPGLNGAWRRTWALDDEGGWTLTPTVAAAWRFERFEPGGEESSSTERHVVSVAAEATLAAAPLNTELLVAARWESAVTVTAADDLHEGDWSGRVALTNRSLADTRLQVGASRSLRLPSTWELFGDDGYVLGNPDLTPERAIGLDVSAAHHASWLPSGWSWSVEVAGFVTFVDDLVQYVQNAQGIARPENLDSARIAGVELGTRADVFEHLRLQAGLTWLDARNTGPIAARTGNRLPFRPELTSYVRAEGYHRFDLPALGEIGLRVDVDVTSGNHLDHANLVEVPDRVLVGLGAHATLFDEQVRVDLAVRNVTGDRVQDLAGFPLPGVSAMLSLRWTPDLPHPEDP